MRELSTMENRELDGKVERTLVIKTTCVSIPATEPTSFLILGKFINNFEMHALLIKCGY